MQNACIHKANYKTTTLALWPSEMQSFSIHIQAKKSGLKISVT